MTALNLKTFHPTLINNENLFVLFGLLSDSNTGKAIDTIVSYFHQQFYFVDADDQQDLASQYNVRIIPTFVIFKNAQVVVNIEGNESIREYVLPKP